MEHGTGRNRLAAILRPAPASLACLALVVSLSMTLTACGDDHSAAGTTNTATAAAAAHKAGDGGATSCPAAVGSFLEAMDRLRNKLALGLDYEGYVEDVHQVSSTYREIRVDDLLVDCLVAAGTPGEKALDQYVGAANMWGECLSEVGCSSYSVEPRLQRRWRLASHYLTQAEKGIGERRSRPKTG